MGFKDFMKVAKTVVTDVISDIDAELQSNPTYVDAREATTKAAAWVVETSADTVDKFEKTEAGRKAGEVTRGVGEFVSTIPVLSAIGDATSEMVGLTRLIELRNEDPDNPWPAPLVVGGLTSETIDKSNLAAAAGPARAILSTCRCLSANGCRSPR